VAPLAVPSRVLRWAVKTSFVADVSKDPEGRVALDEGVIRRGAEFDYPLDDAHDFDPVVGEGLLVFRGIVVFAGHRGLVSVRLADPWIDLAGQRGVLSVAGRADASGRRSRVPVVDFLVRRDVTSDGLRGVEVRLTHAGAQVFERVFAEGEAFDDLRVDGVLARSRAAVPPRRRPSLV
jgi:hypothetical protein